MIGVEINQKQMQEVIQFITSTTEDELQEETQAAYQEVIEEVPPGEQAQISVTTQGKDKMTITLREEGLVRIPSELPIALRIARQLTKETGRRPIVRLRYGKEIE